MLRHTCHWDTTKAFQTELGSSDAKDMSQEKWNFRDTDFQVDNPNRIQHLRWDYRSLVDSLQVMRIQWGTEWKVGK